MDVATALTVAQTLFATLQCAEVRKLCSICSYESELEKLLETVEFINECLRDADSKCQELTNEGQYWVQNLKDVVYDADDLLDEFNTIAHQLKGMPGGKIFKKVRRFFSSNNQLIFAFDKSNEIKKLREKLDSLAKNRRDFGFRELYKPVKRREETCSYVYEQSIIGRDADKETIVDMLLKDDFEKNISFVTIVGIGGLGKTALAQLVFRDHRIKDAFQENMYWVCVSENFDRNWILRKIHKEKNKECTLEDIYKNVQQQIEGKRYLLVLDDVWSEDSKNWDELIDFLVLGGKGSRILVTSRSKKVAEAIGKCQIHELQGLSSEKSWELFKKISLKDRKDESITELVVIGRDILKKCANVPLSIRVMASLLRNQDIAAWQSLKSIDLANMCDGEGGIMPTLMFSYHNLAPELKSCFSFCSLFPQDYEINKIELIRLWMAQGYLVPSVKNESMEAVGEKYISIFIHRCFFQDIERDNLGEIFSFKMHDLMHELCRKVAAKESTTLTACTDGSEGKVCHLFNDHSNEGLTTLFRSSSHPSKKLRTYLNNTVRNTTSDVDAIISNCCRLRVLKLRNSNITGNLQDTIGKLLHLRYLDLSFNAKLEMLPKSITKLHNLQTLLLHYCNRLKELPEETSKLVNLRVLDLNGCDRLSHMPAGMGKLTCLHTLTKFIVFGDDDGLKQDEKGNFRDLIALINNNLRGYVYVYHHANSNTMESHDYMFVNLNSLKLSCSLYSYQEGGQTTLLESLFCCNLEFQGLIIRDYHGTKLPSWPLGLVSIELSCCRELLHLPSSPSLSQLCHLKNLYIKGMEKMKYIECDAPSPPAKFFPALEMLVLRNMPALKSWWRWDVRRKKEVVFIPSFPRLCKLKIVECEKLTHIPPYPHVKEFCLYKVNEAVANCMRVGRAQSNPVSLKIDNSCLFNSLGREFVGSIVCMQLRDIENLGTISEAFRSCASSLQDLDIRNCRGLEKLGIEHLTNLNSLTLKGSSIGGGVPWKSLHTVSSLYLHDLGESFTTLEICHLTSLTALEIQDCFELKSLPEGIKHLTSLKTFTIKNPSPEVKDRCRQPDGEDWLKICHIPNINITTSVLEWDYFFTR